MDYVEACVKNVLNNLYQDSTGSLVLGSVAIPTPPANVGKEFYYKELTLLHCIFILLNFSFQIDGNRPKRKKRIYFSLYFAFFFKDPADFGQWYEDNVDDEFTLGALQLHTSAERETIDSEYIIYPLYW